MELFVWGGVAVCVIHSGIFSGLNLALFGVTRLRLEVEVASGNRMAERVLHLRHDSHFLLATILWGNAAFNTALAILSNSVLAGVHAFLFSTVIITFAGEIAPQAYFSRNALRMASLLAPVLRFYQVIFYPVARPTALLLDHWLGQEGVQYFREHQIREIIKRHIEADEADVDYLEGVGALNFLAIDDLPVSFEGQPLDPDSIITLPFESGRPVFPARQRDVNDPFLKEVHKSERKWVVITDQDSRPQLVLDADGFLRSTLFESGHVSPLSFCHRPIIVHEDTVALGDVLNRLSVQPETPEDDVVDKDIILIWTKDKRVITGADILGRLLRGIVRIG